MPVVIALIASITVIAMWFLNFYIGSQVFDVSRSGLFGDMFGAINSAFSGFALVGIVYGIFIQNKQLKMAQYEAEEEKKLRYKSEFDSNFYNLLRIFSELTTNMDLQNIESHSVTNRGKDCFKSFAIQISIEIDKIKLEDVSSTEIYDSTYNKYYIHRHGDLSHYFRSMYNIIKYVDQSEISNKRFYTNIVRAQLSDHEVIALFFNCISRGGRDKMKPLVEKYALLKHFFIPNGRSDFLKKIDVLKAVYNQSAFGLGTSSS